MIFVPMHQEKKIQKEAGKGPYLKKTGQTKTKAFNSKENPSLVLTRHQARHEILSLKEPNDEFDFDVCVHCPHFHSHTSKT